MRWKLTTIGMAFIAIVVSVACAVLASQYETRMGKLERSNSALRKTNNQQTSLIVGLVEIQGLQNGLIKSMVKNQLKLVQQLGSAERVPASAYTLAP